MCLEVKGLLSIERTLLSQTVTERTSRYLVVLGVIYLCNKCPKMTCVLGCVVTVRRALCA